MAQVQPQAITFTELIRCLANRKQFYVRAFEIFSQMRSFGVRPDEYVIAALLYATAKQVLIVRVGTFPAIGDWGDKQGVRNAGQNHDPKTGT